ncbi:MAG: insulinase family protein [Alphaproteobacteria bacterium]|nr:insulinase family protein [Alphaproteobacteria bacterium]
MAVEITTLENGLRIATDTMPDAESVVVGAWVGVGTRHEKAKANGVAHLVEHMMFKGTKKRSAYELSAAIENKGGSVNAYTTREETAYYARVLPEETANAVDIIADMLRHSVFDAGELDRERQVIIQEIGRSLDTPEDYADDLFYECALPGQKIGRPVLGSAKIIASLPRAEITGYVASHYNAANMVVVAAGKIAHADFVALAKKHFATLPRGKKPAVDKARVSGGESRHDKDIEQVHIYMGFGGPHAHAQARYPAQILSAILGGGAASRLFQEVREKRGLVYTIYTSHAAFSDAGLFQVYAGTDPERLREFIPVVCRELRAVTRKITHDELARAKSQLRADILMGRESVMRRAEMLGHQMLAFGKPSRTERVLQKIDAVTGDDVRALAATMFARPPVLAALGPLARLESYDKIRARLTL